MQVMCHQFNDNPTDSALLTMKQAKQRTLTIILDCFNSVNSISILQEFVNRKTSAEVSHAKLPFVLSHVDL